MHAARQAWEDTVGTVVDSPILPFLNSMFLIILHGLATGGVGVPRVTCGVLLLLLVGMPGVIGTCCTQNCCASAGNMVVQFSAKSEIVVLERATPVNALLSICFSKQNCRSRAAFGSTRPCTLTAPANRSRMDLPMHVRYFALATRSSAECAVPLSSHVLPVPEKANFPMIARSHSLCRALPPEVWDSAWDSPHLSSKFPL